MESGDGGVMLTWREWKKVKYFHETQNCPYGCQHSYDNLIMAYEALLQEFKKCPDEF